MSQQQQQEQQQPALDVLSLGPHQRLDVLVFLPIPEVGRWASCSRATTTDVAGAIGELLWNAAYDNVCRIRAPASEHIRALVARPCGDAAVGCRVAVYSAERNAYLCGLVQAFNEHNNAYLVHYDEPPAAGGESEVWETERRRDEAARFNPMLWTQNRFRFLTLPSDGDEDQRQSPGSALSLMRFSTWAEELKHTLANMPTRRAATIDDHVDEVLFAVFSPCGLKLATCSRDRTTCVFRLDGIGLRTPVRISQLHHTSTALRAQWWPEFPHRVLTVSTGGPLEQPSAEVWDTETGDCLLQVASWPFDIYAAAIRWPQRNGEDWALLAGGGRGSLRGGAQELRIYSLPRVDKGGSTGSREPGKMVRLRLPLSRSSNYCHCPEPAPAGRFHGTVAALTGTCSMQCDVVVLFELPEIMGWPEDDVQVELRTHELPSRAVLSIRWTPDGSLLLANTRPRLGSQPPGHRAAPALSTVIELLVLDPDTLTTLSTHGGHYAFTPSEAPFILHADAWASNDLVASGGEDHCVHVWHRRHGRHLQRLEGHTQAVNAVSWSSAHRLLASASDDHTVILWCPGCRST